MNKLITCLCLALSVLAGCKKSNEEGTSESANAKLIVATYTATKIESSATNNGSDWLEITRVGARETLTIRADGTFTSVTANPVTGASGLPFNGNWSLSADGKILTYTGMQNYTIQTLTTNSLVIVLAGDNKLNSVDAPKYNYTRYTYTRS